MPRYAYICDACEEHFMTMHSSDELLDECEKCGEGGQLRKTLTTPLYSSAKPTKSQKVGQVTEEFIEESRKELKQQKESMNKER